MHPRKGVWQAEFHTHLWPEPPSFPRPAPGISAECNPDQETSVWQTRQITRKTESWPCLPSLLSVWSPPSVWHSAGLLFTMSKGLGLWHKGLEFWLWHVHTMGVRSGYTDFLNLSSLICQMGVIYGISLRGWRRGLAERIEAQSSWQWSAGRKPTTHNALIL